MTMTTGDSEFKVEAEEGNFVYWANVSPGRRINVVARSEAMARTIIALEGFFPKSIHVYPDEEAAEALRLFFK
jgi:hypothetical protein